MSDLLNQAKSAAATALNTATNLASQAVEATTNLANQAANSQAGAVITEQAKNLGAQASTLAGQAHAQAHAAAPSIVPPPAAGSSATSAGVDTRGDLSPTSEKDREKLEKLFEARPNAEELQDKGILKGEPGDALAGQKAALEKSMLEDKLDKELASRPDPAELVKKGILEPNEVPK